MSNLTEKRKDCSVKEQKEDNKHQFLIQKCEIGGNGKAILPSIRKSIEIFRWGMGLGKTYQQQVFISQNQDLRHIYVVPTQALAKEAAKRLGLRCYLDLDDLRLYRKESIVVSMASFAKIRGGIDCLYVDEIESCLEQLNSKTIFTAEEAQATYSALVRDIKETPKVILMDAHAGTATESLVSKSGRAEDVHILTCESESSLWVDVGSKNSHKALLRQRISEGKRIVVACSSKSEAKLLYKHFRKDFPQLDIRCFQADNYHSEIEKHQNPYVCDVLIYTNVIGSGVSIDIRNHYDERHVVICEGTGNARTIQQMSQRLRYPKDKRIYFSGDNRKAKDSLNFNPEKLLHNWRLAKEDTIRLLENLNITVSRHFDKQASRVALLELLAVIEASSVEHGKGWTATWIRENLFVKKYAQKIEGAKEFYGHLKETHNALKAGRAQGILLAPVLLSGELEKLRNKVHKTDKDLYILEKNRLVDIFGNAFSEASKEDKLQIIIEDERGHLTKQTKRFAALELSKTEAGRLALGIKDSSQIARRLDNQLTHSLRRSLVQQEILFKIGMEFDGEPVPIDRKKLSDAFWWARAQVQELERLGISVPGNKKEVKWLSDLLIQVGLKLAKTRPSRSNEDGKRPRIYKLDSSSLERMKQLAQKSISLHLAEDFQSVKEQSSTGFYESLQEVVDQQLFSIRNAEHTDEMGFVRPIRPYIGLYSGVLKGEPVGIDIGMWYKVRQKRKQEGKERGGIELWAEEQITKGKKLRFDTTFRTIRCPRRYPVINREGDKGTLLLSSLPKEYRKSFKAEPGHKIIDFDMKWAHLSILAAISKDDGMKEWLKTDPHQSTGDLLLNRTSEAKTRRKIGKILNSSILAGAGAYSIQHALSKYAVQMAYGEAERLIQNWWKRFPRALHFREEHKRMIAEKVSKGQRHCLRWFGERMFDYEPDLLNGKKQESGWPNAITKRRIKAERSAFTGLLRAYEAMIMEHVFIKANQLGAKLVCPMFDGALFSIKNSFNNEEVMDMCKEET